MPLRDASLGLLILRGIARRFAFERAGETHTLEGCLEGEQGGASLDARRMSYRTRAPNNSAARNHRNSSGKTNPYIMFGGAVVGCLVLGCAWIVYANVFGASVYPTATGGNFDVALVKRAPAPAVPNPPVFDEVFALTSPTPLISTRVGLRLGSSLTFDDRFAAASPQGEAPKPVRLMTGLPRHRHRAKRRSRCRRIARSPQSRRRKLIVRSHSWCGCRRGKPWPEPEQRAGRIGTV